MATYRIGKYKWYNGVEYYAIEMLVWRLGTTFDTLKTWDITKEQDEATARKLMMESVERLVRAGHTVI